MDPIPCPFGRIALVLQGGGALGSYQAGVYQALHEAKLEPDFIAGVSIGAPRFSPPFLSSGALNSAPSGLSTGGRLLTGAWAPRCMSLAMASCMQGVPGFTHMPRILSHRPGCTALKPIAGTRSLGFSSSRYRSVDRRSGWRRIDSTHSPNCASVTERVRVALGDLPNRDVYVRVLQPGRTTYALVHVLVDPTGPSLDVSRADDLRRAVTAAVVGRHAPAVVDIVFTATEAFAAPTTGFSVDRAGAPGRA